MLGTYIPSEYLPVLVFIMIATPFGLGALVLGTIFRPKKPYFAKLMPYESGITPVLPRLCVGHLVADVIANIGTIDIVLGECDR